MKYNEWNESTVTCFNTFEQLLILLNKLTWNAALKTESIEKCNIILAWRENCKHLHICQNSKLCKRIVEGTA